MNRSSRKAANALRAAGLVIGLVASTIAGIGAAIAVNPASRATEASGPATLTALPPAPSIANLQPAPGAEPAVAPPVQPGPRKPARVVNIYGHDATCAIVEVKRGQDGQNGATRCLRRQ